MIQVIGIGGAGTNTIEYLKREDIPGVEYSCFTYNDDPNMAGDKISSEAKIVFLTAGMGGKTGTNGINTIAKICRERGILTIALVTMPFSYEGAVRTHLAMMGAGELEKHVHKLVKISNNMLRQSFGHLQFNDAMDKADAILCNIIKCVSRLLVAHSGESVITNIKSFFQNNETMNTDEGKYVERALRAAMTLGIGIYCDWENSRLFAAFTPCIDDK